jgi:hypothetical protein
MSPYTPQREVALIRGICCQSVVSFFSCRSRLWTSSFWRTRLGWWYPLRRGRPGGRPALARIASTPGANRTNSRTRNSRARETPEENSPVKEKNLGRASQAWREFINAKASVRDGALDAQARWSFYTSAQTLVGDAIREQTDLNGSSNGMGFEARDARGAKGS